MADKLDRTLVLEMVRVTEAAAIAAVKYAGGGNKEKVDAAAVDAMRRVLGELRMSGQVVIGEGEKDEAPMLYNGERVGSGSGPSADIAVDPIDGTTLLSKGLPGAIAVIAVSSGGTMNVPSGIFYMDKIAVGPAARDAIDINAPVADNLKRIAKALGKQVSEVTAVVLDRPRHSQLLADIRAAGARVKMISDGDVAAGLQTALPGSGTDVLLGIGGAPEGVILAAAMRCTGGSIQCKPWPRDDAEREKAVAAGVDLNRVYRTEDMVGGTDAIFSATGASTGELLRGVMQVPGGVSTQSIVLHAPSGTLRWIEATYRKA